MRSLTSLMGPATGRHRYRPEQSSDVMHGLIEGAAKLDVKRGLRRVSCPRTKSPIPEKSCAECRAAAHLVPALAEACGKCPRNREA